mmetsp:Transcript_19152/g.17371  ORF Transcript_19152/g.17371 Transcript_19152/m.17371 type:complete len:81 (-) Transcript_19152:189-431(-)
MIIAENKVASTLKAEGAKQGLTTTTTEAVIGTLAVATGSVVSGVVARNGGVALMDCATKMSNGYRIVGDSMAKTTMRVAA